VTCTWLNNRVRPGANGHTVIDRHDLKGVFEPMITVVSVNFMCHPMNYASKVSARLNPDYFSV